MGQQFMGLWRDWTAYRQYVAAGQELRQPVELSQFIDGVWLLHRFGIDSNYVEFEGFGTLRDRSADTPKSENAHRHSGYLNA